MSHASFTRTALAAALALGVAAAAHAQNSTSSTSSNAMTSRSTNSNSAALSSSDRKFIEKAAQGGMAEVELGKLAQEKGSSDQVKQFGKRMVDDHTKANDQLKSLATAKGVQVPTELDRSDRREMDRLSKKSGADFDKDYMSHMVSDHKKDVSDFQHEAKGAKDADVRNFAATTLPVLEQHLDLAKSTEAAVKNEGKQARNDNNAANTSAMSSAPRK